MEHGRTMEHGENALDHGTGGGALRLPSIRLARPAVSSPFGLGEIAPAAPVEPLERPEPVSIADQRPLHAPRFSSRFGWTDGDGRHPDDVEAHAQAVPQGPVPISNAEQALHEAFTAPFAPLPAAPAPEHVFTPSGYAPTGYASAAVEPLPYDEIPVAPAVPLPPVPEAPLPSSVFAPTPPRATGLDAPERWAVRYALTAYLCMLLVVGGSVYYAWRI